MSIPCEEYVKIIHTAWGQGVTSIIQTGECVSMARRDVGEGKFEAEIIPRLPFKRSTAYALMKIASNAVLSNVQHVGHLPPHWGTLAALTRVKQKRLLAAIESCEVHPGMQRKDVAALLPPPKKPAQRDDDLPPNYEGSNAPSPDDGADAMKSRFAAMDSGDETTVSNRGNGAKGATDVVADCVAQIKAILDAAIAELGQEERLDLLDRVEKALVRMKFQAEPIDPERWGARQ